jgi:rsbT antagonist protein RsbS
MTSDDRIPVAFLHDKLILTLVQSAVLDEQMEALRRDVCGAIDRHEPTALLIDVSPLVTLDSYLTRAIRDLALTAKLMGVQTVVCGLRPAVAVTLVEMDLELPGVRTALNLERALWVLSDDATPVKPERRGPRV